MKKQDKPAIDRPDPDFETRSRAQDQPSLFATEDLIIPDGIRSYRKAVSAIHVVPVNSSHTYHTSKLFDACILIAQLDFKLRPRDQVARIKTERISITFETRITDLVRLAGIPGKNYKRIYEDLDFLFEMVLKWNVLDEDAAVAFEMKSHFFTMLGKGVGHKRGAIRFSFHPDVMDIVLEPSNWATLSLKAMDGLGTLPSYALYQQTFRYLGTTAKCTASLPTETWIDLLLGPSRYVKTDPATGKKTVTSYGDFKRRVLNDAITRVNEAKALNYTLRLDEKRAGNRVSKLQFFFIPKKQASLGLPLTWPEDGLKLLTNMGFSEAEINDISQSDSYEVIAESLTRLKAAEVRARERGKPITSRKAYFSGILSRVSQGATGADLEIDRVEEEVRIQAEAKADKERQERQREAFEKHQSDVSTQRLFAMDAKLRDALFARFEGTPEGKKAKVFIDKGWTPRNTPAVASFKNWLKESNNEVYLSLLQEPEDRSFDSWVAWRLEALANQSP